MTFSSCLILISRVSDATEQIRDLGFKGVILGVTGNVLPEDVNYFISKGADSVVGKPVSIAVLQEVWTNPTSQEHRPNEKRRSSRVMLRKLSSEAA